MNPSRRHWFRFAGLGALAPLGLLTRRVVAQDHAGHIATEPPAAAVEARIEPVGEVEVVAVESGPHVDKSGEEVVGSVCAACHASGAMGAPKIGDKAGWAPRIAQGYETLIKHAIEGIRMMPARGGNATLTDGEIANAVAHMANESGAKFTPPAPKAQ